MGAEDVSIELSRDRGVSWERLASFRPANSSEWTWREVTPPFSCECRIRVTASGVGWRREGLTEGDFHVVPEDMAHEADRTFEFGGRRWGVRAESAGFTQDPGNNHWGDGYDNVWLETVDGSEELHLKIVNRDGRWYCSEVFVLEPTGYGPYRFYLVTCVDALDPLVVAGLFLYRNDCNEVDIEFSTWGRGPSSDNLQYAVQPAEVYGNVQSSSMELSGAYTTHCIDWQPAAVRFNSIHGHFTEPPNTCYCIPNPVSGFCLPDVDRCGWEYRGADVPPLERGLRVHMNLWLLDTDGENAPLDGREVEIAIRAVEIPGPE